MLQRSYAHRFRARIELLDFGRMAYHAVFLPAELLAQLPLKQYPKLRVDVAIGSSWFNGALQSAKEGKYLLLSGRFLKEAVLSLGDSIEVRFNIADQSAVDVPWELEEAIFRNRTTRRIWDSLTLGKRRGYSYRVASARRPETREQRVLEVLEKLGEESNCSATEE